MIFMKSTTISVALQKTIFWTGFLTTFIVPTLIAINLSNSENSIYAIVCAIVCFLVFYFINKKSYKHSERINKGIEFLFWCGLGEIVVAIFFWTDPQAPFIFLVEGLNNFCSSIGYFCAFAVLFNSLFPQAFSASKHGQN